MEDFAPRERPFPWGAIEWFLRRVGGERGHALTLAEAQTFCRQVGLRVNCGKAFTVNWLWHAWVLRASAYT